MEQNDLDIILNYPKIKDLIKDRPSEVKNIEKYFNEIRGEFSDNWVSLAAKVIDSTFLKLYNGVQIDVAPSMNLTELQEKYNIILVPNHQSHADYIALTYSLYKHFNMQIYVAGGINLNIFLIGSLFKKSGAFFIRRQFQDNPTYKVTLEAYIYLLLKSNKVVEFFFEGGRTRTGKLLSPRFGLFRMILDSYHYLEEGKKPLMFVPVSIAHEHIPEERAHRKETEGAKKTPESSAQLLKIFSLMNKKLGSINIRVNEGIIVNKVDMSNLKMQTQDLAFDCFRSVGKHMPITPSSLLAVTMLDDAIGALTWKQIEDRCIDTIKYCMKLNIPFTPTLKLSSVSESIKLALDIFINNSKIEVISNDKLNQVFYAINEAKRAEVLYHKNMILHHFLVPVFINLAWYNILNNKISSEKELLLFLNNKRKELKYEFYLPTIKEMFFEARDIVMLAIGKEIQGFSDILNFNQEELLKIGETTKRFSSILSYIYEAYFISAVTLKYLSQEEIKIEKFLEISRELFLIELEHGRVVKYTESYSVPLLKNTLSFFINQKAIEYNEETKVYSVSNLDRVNYYIEKFANDLNDQMSINLKFSTSTSISPR